MKKLFLTGAISALLCGKAAAMHPLITEDTGFLGKGARQTEIGFEYSQTREGADSFSRSLAAEVSYGLGDTVDLLLTIPHEGYTAGGASESGLGDLALDAKFRVAEKSGWTVALKPGLSLPTGDEDKGLGAGKSGFRLHGVAGRSAGPWQYYLNAGYGLNRNSSGDKEDILSGSAAVAYEIMDKTLLAADIAYETSADPAAAAHPLCAVLGLAWSPDDDLDLDAGVRLGLNDAADDLGLLLGATFRF